MIRFLRYLLFHERDTDLLEIAAGFRDIMVDQKEIISAQQAEIARLKLEYTRWGRDCLENFLIALDRPEAEDELRENLHNALTDMSDEVARLEEHFISPQTR